MINNLVGGLFGKIVDNAEGILDKVITTDKERDEAKLALKKLLLDAEREAFAKEVEDRKSARDMYKDDAIIQKVLAHSGLKTVAVGNIGKPILSYNLGRKRNVVMVIEMSSFQLEYSKYIKPNHAILLNITKHISKIGKENINNKVVFGSGDPNADLLIIGTATGCGYALLLLLLYSGKFTVE